MKRTLLILILITSFHYLAGQALVLDNGDSGFDIGTSFSTSKSATKVYIGGGYTFNGKLHIGADIGISNLKDQNMVLPSINTKLSYFILRQNEYTMPISLSFDGNFEYGSALYSGLVTKINLFLIGATVSHTFDVKKSVNIITSATLGCGNVNATAADISLQGYYISLSLKATMTIRKFYISPKVNFGETPAFAIDVGTVFPRFQVSGI